MIGVDEERLRGEGVTPNEAFYLYSLKNIENIPLGKMSNISFLKEFDYLDSEGVLTEKSIKFLSETFMKITIKKTVTQSDVKDLTEKFRELFPAKIKSGGIPVKSNLDNLIAKMITFKSKHPKITDEIILAATAKYVESKRKEGYAFMSTAEYMISKNSTSLLATLCDAYEEDSKNGGTEEVKWGRSIL